MSDSGNQRIAIEAAVSQEVSKSGRVFDTAKKVSSELNYLPGAMERLLQAVQIDLLTAYHYAYAKGDGAAQVTPDHTLSQVITFIANKTT
jgi:hypothetical protein